MPNGSKFANELMFAVKGHLIPEEYNKSDIDKMEQQYMKRLWGCLLYTSPSPRDRQKSRMPSSA